MAAFDLRAFERIREGNNERFTERNGENDRENLDATNDYECLENNLEGTRRTETLDANLSPTRLREECIIAFKVYDSCRQQDCLDNSLIGPARAAETVCFGEEHIREGDVIDPPSAAAAVTVSRLRVKKIIIVDKRMNELREGFWDIDLKYVFEYLLTFRGANGDVLRSIRANSIYNKSVTLFGSIGAGLAVSTDLLNFHECNSMTLDAEPFVWVEAKAVALHAQLHYQRLVNCGPQDFAPEPNSVRITIGLFTIIKLFRIANLTVQSHGFCIPNECDEVAPLQPCEFFENLDFPMDVFAPPQRPEFMAGISNNIPRSRPTDNSCCCNSCNSCNIL